MDGSIRRWLAKTPLLLTAYLTWTNRRRRGARAGRRKGIAAAVAVCGAVVVGFLVFAYGQRLAAVPMSPVSTAAVSTLAWLNRHDLFWGGISAIISAVLVSRRRALNRAAAARHWTAALPLERSAAGWQTLIVDSVPAITMFGVLAVVFGMLSMVVFASSNVPLSVATWGATTGGTVIGAALGHIVPLPSQEETYEGSRYVPHRRRAQTPVPAASFAALGAWPVREMFASARPKTVSRILIPILLAVPLQWKAADVLVALGALTVLGAFVVLVTAVISVNTRARRWLSPLPVQPALLMRRILGRSAALMCCAAGIEAWLMWVLRS